MPTAELTKEDAQQEMVEGRLIHILVKQLSKDETFDGAQSTLSALSIYGWLSIIYIISPYLTQSKISFKM